MAVGPYVTWKTEEPPVGEYRESPVYPIFGDEWAFCLHTRLENGEKVWKIHQHCKEKSKNSPRMTMAAYIKDKSRRLNEMELSPILMKKATWSSFVLRETRKEDFLVNGDLIFVFMFEALPQFLLKTIEEVVSVFGLYSSCLETDFEELMRALPPPDVKLKCEDHIVTAHKAVLTKQSEVFAAMFRTDMLEGREDSVGIEDVEFHILQLLARYLYLGKLPNLTFEEASLLYEAADKYAVETLKSSCSDFLTHNLTEKNALKLFVLADLHSDQQLKDRILSYFVGVNLPLRSQDWDEFCHHYQHLAVQIKNPPVSACVLRTAANVFRQ